MTEANLPSSSDEKELSSSCSSIVSFFSCICAWLVVISPESYFTRIGETVGVFFFLTYCSVFACWTAVSTEDSSLSRQSEPELSLWDIAANSYLADPDGFILLWFKLELLTRVKLVKLNCEHTIEPLPTKEALIREFPRSKKLSVDSSAFLPNVATGSVSFAYSSFVVVGVSANSFISVSCSLSGSSKLEMQRWKQLSRFAISASFAFSS